MKNIVKDAVPLHCAQWHELNIIISHLCDSCSPTCPTAPQSCLQAGNEPLFFWLQEPDSDKDDEMLLRCNKAVHGTKWTPAAGAPSGTTAQGASATGSTGAAQGAATAGTAQAAAAPAAPGGHAAPGAAGAPNSQQLAHLQCAAPLFCAALQLSGLSLRLCVAHAKLLEAALHQHVQITYP